VGLAWSCNLEVPLSSQQGVKARELPTAYRGRIRMLSPSKSLQNWAKNSNFELFVRCRAWMAVVNRGLAMRKLAGLICRCKG